jgi:hypothetical protein
MNKLAVKFFWFLRDLIGASLVVFGTSTIGGFLSMLIYESIVYPDAFETDGLVDIPMIGLAAFLLVFLISLALVVLYFNKRSPRG